MNASFQEKTIYLVVVLASETGKKKLMIARIPDDEEYEKNRNNFLTVAMGRCRVERCEIEDIQTIRSEEELIAYKARIQNDPTGTPVVPSAPSKGWEIYKELLADLRRECDEMVKNGEFSQEDADFRYYMVKDEILESLPDELFVPTPAKQED